MRAGAWRGAALGILLCGWGGNQFTPLLVMYRQLGYSVLAVDLLLGAYVLGLVPGLLVAGRLSERLGRRAVMVGGVASSVVASLLIAAGDLGVAWIAAGRFVAGLGVAVAMAVGTTWVVELCEVLGAGAAAGARRAALWLTLGFGGGAGVAGTLAQWGPAPTVVPYAVHAALALAVLPVLLRLPETRDTGLTTTSGGVAGVGHPRFLRVVVPMGPWIFGSAGIAYAVMPQVVSHRVGAWGLAYSTLLTVATLGTGALVQPLAKRLDRTTSARAVATAMTAMALGLLVSAAAAAAASPIVALLAAVTLGGAYGVAMVAGLLEVQRLAPPHALATCTGVYYALAYSGFLLPAALASLGGLASYAVLLTGLAMVALVGLGVILRHSRHALPAR
jgi:Na+/melibiose symporter-like transporter